jgi:hypothetical protein
MLSLFALFNLGPIELFFLLFGCGGVLAVAAVVVFILAVFMRGKKKDPENE